MIPIAAADVFFNCFWIKKQACSFVVAQNSVKVSVFNETTVDVNLRKGAREGTNCFKMPDIEQFSILFTLHALRDYVCS